MAPETMKALCFMKRCYSHLNVSLYNRVSDCYTFVCSHCYSITRRHCVVSHPLSSPCCNSEISSRPSRDLSLYLTKLVLWYFWGSLIGLVPIVVFLPRETAGQWYTSSCCKFPSLLLSIPILGVGSRDTRSIPYLLGIITNFPQCRRQDTLSYHVWEGICYVSN
ncbi:hypothetical protein F4781DRAFT_392116 [Annulohypoxylon bovei var. microspora]|nr:hypothetical protein F4781DRAFT_392116 [Annulohypoxylon bovei var. microspora]